MIYHQIELIGKALHGYCNGFFGSGPDYMVDRVIEDFGPDWVVARRVDTQEAEFANFSSLEEMLGYLNEWLEEGA